MRDFRESLVVALKRHEGFSHVPYTCSAGFLTIGYGHNLSEGISIETAEHLLAEDIDVVLQELTANKPFWIMMPLDVRLVIANMCFNLGWPKFKLFMKFWAAVESGDFVLAAKEMRDSLWFHQVGRRGIELANIMEQIGGISGSIKI